MNIYIYIYMNNLTTTVEVIKNRSWAYILNMKVYSGDDYITKLIVKLLFIQAHICFRTCQFIWFLLIGATVFIASGVPVNYTVAEDECPLPEPELKKHNDILVTDVQIETANTDGPFVGQAWIGYKRAYKIFQYIGKKKKHPIFIFLSLAEENTRWWIGPGLRFSGTNRH